MTNPPSRHSSDDGRTQSLPFCDSCPSTRTWPARNLIIGTCPRCGRFNAKSWRTLVARRLTGSSL